MKKIWAPLAAIGMIAALAQPALAKDITVKMMTSGPGGAMVFVPAFTKAAVGDVVHFVPSDGSHNAETIDNMLPAGVAPMKGLMGKPMALTLSKPGVYGVKCLPHYSMGMVGLVEAGAKAPNLAAAKAVKLAPLAQKRMTPLLAQAS